FALLAGSHIRSNAAATAKPGASPRDEPERTVRSPRTGAGVRPQPAHFNSSPPDLLPHFGRARGVLRTAIGPEALTLSNDSTFEKPRGAIPSGGAPAPFLDAPQRFPASQCSP